MVPKTMSRDQIGKKIEGGIVEYFHQKYGPPNTESFQTVTIHGSYPLLIYIFSRHAKISLKVWLVTR